MSESLAGELPRRQALGTALHSPSKYLNHLAALAAIAAITCTLAVMLLRVGYPHELEWQEGGMVAHVQRVLRGEPLFVQPSLEFAPFPYPPLYTWVACALSLVVGDELLALRLVSMVSTVVTLLLLHGLVARETSRPLAGLVAAGLYAAAFGFGGAWFDVGRVDALALALSVAAWSRARDGGSKSAAVLVVLAGFTKQTTVLFTLPAVAVLRGRKGASPGMFLTVAVGGLAAAYGLLHLATDGTSSWTLFTLLNDHPYLPKRVWGFWTEVLIALAPAGLGLLVLMRAEPTSLRWWCWPLVGALVAAWLGRIHVGGYDNTLLPAALAASVAGGLAVGRCLGAVEEPVRGGLSRWLAPALVTLQVGLLSYDPRSHLPDPASLDAGELVVGVIGSVEGEVFAPYHGYLAMLAGKNPGVHAMALFDLSASEQEEEKQRLFTELRSALSEGRYSAVLLARPEPFEPLLAERYRFERDLAPSGVLGPTTGQVLPGARLYLRR